MIKAIIPVELKKRKSDRWGKGHFGAPRGDRIHTGQDYLCPEQSQVLSPVDGIITKLGYPYSDDISFRYVRILTDKKEYHDVFYVEPILPIDHIIKKGDIIGFSQDLTKRYPGIKNHVHYQIKVNGCYIDPEKINVS